MRRPPHPQSPKTPKPQNPIRKNSKKKNLFTFKDYKKEFVELILNLNHLKVFEVNIWWCFFHRNFFPICKVGIKGPLHRLLSGLVPYKVESMFEFEIYANLDATDSYFV